MIPRWRSFLRSVLLVATIVAVLNTRRIVAAQEDVTQPPSAPGRSWASAKVARATARARVAGHKTREFFSSAATHLGTPDPSRIADVIKDTAAATATHFYDALPSFREIVKSLREPSSVEPGELLSRLEQLVSQLERGMEAPASSPDQQASLPSEEQQLMAPQDISSEDDDDGECDAADAQGMPVHDPSHQQRSQLPSSQPPQHLTQPEADPVKFLLDEKHRNLLQLLVVVLCLSHSVCFLLGKSLGARQASLAAAAQRQAGAELASAAAAQQVLHQQGAGLPEQDACLAGDQHQEPSGPTQEAPTSSSTSHSSVAGSTTTPAAPTGASAAGKKQQAAGAPAQAPALQLASPTSDLALTAALDAADAAAGITAVDTASSSPAGSSRPHTEQHSSGAGPSGSMASSSNSQQGSNAAAPAARLQVAGDAIEAAASAPAHAGSSYHTLQQGGDGSITSPDQVLQALVQHCFSDHQDARIADPLLAQAVQEGKMLPVAYGKHVIHIHPAMCSTLGRAMIVCGYGMATLGRGFSQLAGVVTGATAAMHSVTTAVSTAAEQVNKVNTALGRLSDRADSAERAARCGRCASFGFGVMVAAVFACALWRGRIWDVAAICAAAAGPAASGGWFGSLGVMGFQRQVTSGFRTISCYLEQLGLYMLAGMVLVRWVLPRVLAGQSAERMVLVDIVLLQMVLQAALGGVLVSCLGGSWLLWGLLWEAWCLLQVLLHQLRLPGWARMCVELQVALLLPAAAAWMPFQAQFRGLGEGWLTQAMAGGWQ